MHWLAVALAKAVSPCWTSQWDTQKQRFKVNLGSRPGQTKTSWVKKLSTHHQHVRARCNTWVTPDRGFVISLTFSLKAVCGIFLLLLLLFPEENSRPRSADSSRPLAGSANTKCCQTVCGWIPGDGPEDKMRYVTSAKVRGRRGLRGCTETMHSVPALPRRRHWFRHANPQTAGGQHEKKYEVILFQPQMKPEVLKAYLVFYVLILHFLCT